MTKKLEKRFKELRTKNNGKNPIVIAKYFNPAGPGDWYATEYNPIDKIFFGYVSIFGDMNDEWGEFSLKELKEFKGPLGLKIERDVYCKEKPINEFNIPSLNL